jgi:hypothetical protein
MYLNISARFRSSDRRGRDDPRCSVATQRVQNKSIVDYLPTKVYESSLKHPIMFDVKFVIMRCWCGPGRAHLAPDEWILVSPLSIAGDDQYFASKMNH